MLPTIYSLCFITTSCNLYYVQCIHKWEQTLSYVHALQSINLVFTTGGKPLLPPPNSSWTKCCYKNFCFTCQCLNTLSNLWSLLLVFSTLTFHTYLRGRVNYLRAWGRFLKLIEKMLLWIYPLFPRCFGAGITIVESIRLTSSKDSVRCRWQISDWRSNAEGTWFEY